MIKLLQVRSPRSVRLVYDIGVCSFNNKREVILPKNTVITQKTQFFKRAHLNT